MACQECTKLKSPHWPTDRNVRLASFTLALYQAQLCAGDLGNASRKKTLCARHPAFTRPSWDVLLAASSIITLKPGARSSSSTEMMTVCLRSGRRSLGNNLPRAKKKHNLATMSACAWRIFDLSFRAMPCNSASRAEHMSRRGATRPAESSSCGRPGYCAQLTAFPHDCAPCLIIKNVATA